MHMLARRLFITFFAANSIAIAAAPPAALPHEKRLEVGPGPEDVCTTVWRGEPIVITSCSERRNRKNATENRGKQGFYFIGIRDGVPARIGFQSCDSLGTKLPWVGLHWQTHGVPGHRQSGVLAAAESSSVISSEKAAYHVDLFVWDELSACPKLRRLNGPPLPNLGERKDQVFNAVALASNGDVYATTFGLTRSWFAPQTCHELATSAASNSLYLLPHGGCAWQRVARHVSGANGLAFSPDEKFLAVAAYHGKCVLWLARDGGTGGITSIVNRVKLGAGNPDNLRVCAPGVLAAGCSHKLSTGITLLTEHFWGVRLVPSAPGVVITMPDTPDGKGGVAVQLLPKDYACPSGITKLGKWWITSQILDDHLLCWHE